MDIQQGNVINAKMMLQLRPDMTKAQVRFILGTPLIQDSFHKDRWDYLYQLSKGGKVVEQRRVILNFENDQLKAVRGDVIPAGSALQEAAAATPSTASSAAGQAAATEQPGMLDKLKFWQDKPADKSQAAAASTPTPGFTKDLPVAEALVPGAIVPATAAATTAALSAPTASDTTKAQAQPAQPQPRSETLIIGDGASAAATAGEEDPAAVAVKDTVYAWAQAWQRKDATAYIQFYSDKFVSAAAPNRKTWIAQTKRQFAKPGQVELQLEDLKVSLAGAKASAEFTQHYVSGKYSEHVRKLLQLEKVGANWLIVSELAVPGSAADVVVQAVPDAAAVGGNAVVTDTKEKSASKLAVADVSAAVSVRLQAWADAWRKKDVAAYLSFYADKFVPDSASGKSAWLVQRKQRFSKPGAISLQLENIKISPLQNQARVEFTQRYSANGYSDNVAKTMQWEFINGRWLITRESAATGLSPALASPSPVEESPKLTPEQKSESYAPPAAVLPPAAATAPVEKAPAPVNRAQDDQRSSETEKNVSAKAVQQKSGKEQAAQEQTAKDQAAKAKQEETELEETPGLFERLLEKIGF